MQRPGVNVFCLNKHIFVKELGGDSLFEYFSGKNKVVLQQQIRIIING